MQAQSSLEVERMCVLAEVSRASYYRWLEPPENDGVEEMRLRNAIQQACLEHRFYGYRRITALLRQQDWIVNRKRVRRLMNEDGLLAIRRRKFVATTNSAHKMLIYPNLAGSLELSALDQLWVADLTYIRLRLEFVFLAVVLDAYSRRVVGWGLGDELTSELALAALDKAVQLRNPRPGLVHHSDRGSQYASSRYAGKLENMGALASMSRPGKPWENGKCESFMKTFKKEEIDARQYRDRKELESNIEDFIERDYNRVRLHSALGYRSPIDFENITRQTSETSRSIWKPAAMSFSRHEEIYSDGS